MPVYNIDLPEDSELSFTDAAFIDDTIWGGDDSYNSLLAKIEDRFPCVSIQEDEDMSKKKKDKEATQYCTKCGVSDKTAYLVWVLGAKQVPSGTDGAVLECLHIGDCNDRKYKTKKNGTSTQGKPYDCSQASVFKCRHEPTEAFILNGIHYYGGSEFKIDFGLLDTTWFVVSLLGGTTREPIKSSIPNLVDSLRSLVCVPDLIIDWPDMKAPPIKPGFWLKLHTLVKKRKKVNKVLFYCVGGHGRTGTALSGTLVECSQTQAVDAVKFVRQYYCAEAVETADQVNYLKRLQECFCTQTVLEEPTKQEEEVVNV